MKVAPFTSTCCTLIAISRVALITAGTLLLACSPKLTPTESIEVASKGLHSAAISADGQGLVVGSIHHGGSYWQTTSTERLFNWNHDNSDFTTIVAADIAQDGRWAVTADPFSLVLWSTQDGRSERYWTAPAEILDIALSAQGNTALLGLSDHSAVLFDIRRGGIVKTFHHQNRVRSVDMSQDGRLALTGSEDYSAILWDINSGKQLRMMRHEDDVQLVKLSQDASIALSVSKYDKALLWHTQTGEHIGQLALKAEHVKRGMRVVCARFSEDNQLLLTGRADQMVELWEVATLKKLAQWELPKRNAWKPTSAAVLDVAFTEQGNVFAATASNGFHHILALNE